MKRVIKTYQMRFVDSDLRKCYECSINLRTKNLTVRLYNSDDPFNVTIYTGYVDLPVRGIHREWFSTSEKDFLNFCKFYTKDDYPRTLGLRRMKYFNRLGKPLPRWYETSRNEF